MAQRLILLCAGLWMLLDGGGGEFLEEDLQRIVNLHNDYRSSVEPPASDMIRMTWDESLAVTAGKYAAECIWDHNPEVMNTLGENLFITSGGPDIEKALLDWFKEHEDYTYDNNTCPENKMCGHYTQMVWAKTNKVGCGAHVCESVQSLDFKNAWMMVCNYFPPGNVVGQKPYAEGDPCSKCPDNLSDCVKKTCDSTVSKDKLPSVELTKLQMTDMPNPTPTESSESSEIRDALPTEIWLTDMTHTQPVESSMSGSGIHSSAFLLLTGLLALLWF